MKRVLFIQQIFRPPGGGNTVANWLLQALKDEFEVTLLTWEPVDWSEVNRFFGTRLDPTEFRTLHPSALVRACGRLDPDPLSVQPMMYLTRWGKRLRHAYDVCLSADFEHDFGGRGIQYVHFPGFMRQAKQPQLPPHAAWPQKVGALVRGGYRPWQILGQFSFDAMKQNLTLVNSDWTGRLMTEVYGIPTTTLYPPVPMDFPPIPWEHRENGFVCIGRLDIHKRPDTLIEIVGQVRRRVADAHLHIIGSPQTDTPSQVQYTDKVRRLAREYAEWVTLHEYISRQELTQLVARHRYGIHGMVEEPFGIAVAEMTLAGCIVFAPNSGGPVEILGHDERLLYDGVDDAVAKIRRVMDHPDQQADLRQRLATRQELFSTETFSRRIREIVGEFKA